MGYSSWGQKESDTTEEIEHTHTLTTFQGPTVYWIRYTCKQITINLYNMDACNNIKMKEKEGILGAEEQRCHDLRCISHEKVTDSICDPGNKTEAGKWGKDSQQDPLRRSLQRCCKGQSAHPEGHLGWETRYQTPGPSVRWYDKACPASFAYLVSTYLEIFLSEGQDSLSKYNPPNATSPHSEKSP